MATKQLKTKILLLNGTQTEWQNLADYVLSKGEPAVEFIPADGSTLTEVRVKIGDGFTPYKNLPYVGKETADKLAELVTTVNGLSSTLDGLQGELAKVGNAVFQVSATSLKDASGSTEADKLAAYLLAQNEDLILKDGNIAIVDRLISEEYTDKDSNVIPARYSYTAYVYTQNKFVAMDGNYDASNVYFDSDITYTANIGAVTLPSGKSSGSFNAKGKSLEEVLRALMALTKNPTIKAPTFSLSASGTTDTGTLEIGSKITKFTWDGTWTDGTYEYGYLNGDGTVNTTKQAGCTPSYAISCTEAGTASGQTVDGTWTLTTAIAIDSDSSKSYGVISNNCTYGDSPRTPVNNIGEGVSGKITGSSIPKEATISLTGYREGFYFGTVTTDVAIDAITSSMIRGLAIKSGANYGSGKKTVEVPVGAKTIIIACPASETGVTNILNTTVNANMNESFKVGGTANTVTVGGADSTEDSIGDYSESYNVWAFTPPEAYGTAATLEITLG